MRGATSGLDGRSVSNNRVLDLIIDMQARSAGMSTAEITSRYGVGRSTAKRWIEEIGDFGYDVVEVPKLEDDHHRTKRWKLREFVGDEWELEVGVTKARALRFHATLDAQERIAAETLLNRLEGEEKNALRKLLVDDKGLSEGWAVEAEKLIARTAHAHSVGVKLSYDVETLKTAEFCVQNKLPITIKYRSPTKQRASRVRVRPLGILYGRFVYLVASRTLIGKIGLPIQYRLDLIQEAEEGDDEFALPNGYDFKAWAKQSFGVQHGRIHTFQLIFKKTIAERARAVQFHPSQKVISKSNREGEYVIEMTCSGHQEVFHEISHPDWLGRVSLRGDTDLMDEYGRYVSLVSRAEA